MTDMSMEQIITTLRTIKTNGLNPALYVVVTEIENRLIVKHRLTGEIRVLEKQGGAYGETVHGSRTGRASQS